MDSRTDQAILLGTYHRDTRGSSFLNQSLISVFRKTATCHTRCEIRELVSSRATHIVHAPLSFTMWLFEPSLINGLRHQPATRSNDPLLRLLAHPVVILLPSLPFLAPFALSSLPGMSSLNILNLLHLILATQL